MTWAAVAQAEDAAAYAYGVCGVELSGSERTRAQTLIADHQAARVRAAGEATAAGEQPPAAPAAFDLQGIRTAEAARAELARVENALVAVYAEVVANSTGQSKHYAVKTAVECAVRAVTWGASSQAFPTA